VSFAFNQIIMARTTINIENPILMEVKKLQKQDGRSIGKIVSQLLAEALAQRKGKTNAPRFKWHSRQMGTLVDFSDKEALYKILDRGKD
jgi:hypothetical protein